MSNHDENNPLPNPTNGAAMDMVRKLTNRVGALGLAQHQIS